MKDLQLAQEIVKILDDKKANDIKVLKIEDLTVVTNYIVIATGNSTTQVRALSDEVDFKLKTEHNIMYSRIEGYDSKNWILVDYDTVILHVFLPDSRDYYNLDKLWADGQEIDITDLLT